MFPSLNREGHMVNVTTWWGVSLVDMSVADFSDLGEARGKIINERTLKLSLDGGSTTLRGDFDFNKKGQLVGGEVASIEFGFGQYDGVTFSRLKLDIGLLSKVAETSGLQDDAKLFTSIFSKPDKITAGQENDILNGGGGNDTLIGEMGADDMSGGAGADIFFYNDQFESDDKGADEILDFSQSEGDKINLRNVADFDFIGKSDAPGDASELRYYFEGGKTVIESDVSGNGFMFFTIKLKGEIELTEADFIF
jgi:Ca2+-binding RTX toxin-like protein